MGLHIGSIAPDFEAETSEGKIKFHEWAGTNWVVFFSHPKDFTPVCTTELGAVSKLREELGRRNAKALALSVDPVDSHTGWIKDIEETQQAKMNFPIVADPDQQVAKLYDMVHPELDAKITVRSVFFVDPNKKVRAMITYPPSTGRNFGEVLRVIDSLQLTDHHSVATPADWKDGDDCVIVPSLQDPEVMKQKFPKGWTVLKPYLRMTPQPNKK
jgi:thioredoxin-dependent peroxiredoxin